ncbi:unnamed protein product [Phytophthora fragariaefolia]|uniref:Unnamed protein product n=1 Tax=Phytophthora fragariaefolia TaxID=1490495 RepID=A0A9W7CSS3_9STRA|nr:unnamed protein product [Phytophthora fragariaefolia]
MDFCTLRPPNDRFLSDDIVGDVVQRRIPGRHFQADTYNTTHGAERRYSNQAYRQSRAFEYTRARQAQASYLTKPDAIIPERDAIAVLGLLSLTGEKRKRDSPTTFISNKSRHEAPESCSQQAETDTESMSSDKPETPMTEWSPASKHYQGEYRWDSQVQHKKEHEHMINLEKETRQLREEIMIFEQQRRAISAVLPARQNGWDVALEYFQQFRFGLQARGRSSANKPTVAQLELLRTAMVPGVVFNSGQGVEAMLRSWKCLSLWFQDVELELEGLDRGAAGSLVAITRTSITITERTLRNVFPHLCSNSSYRRLADRLLGQRIVMRGLTRFEWDGSCGRFTSVMAHSDLLTPILQLLGNVEDVSLVFVRSIISPDFHWRLSK